MTTSFSIWAHLRILKNVSAAPGDFSEDAVLLGLRSLEVVRAEHVNDRFLHADQVTPSANLRCMMEACVNTCRPVLNARRFTRPKSERELSATTGHLAESVIGSENGEQ